MGKLRFVLIFCTILIVGALVGMFVVENGTQIPLSLLVSATPIEISAGGLAAYAFLCGLIVGILFCVAYVAIQAIELRELRRQSFSHKQQLESLRNLSLKDSA